MKILMLMTHPGYTRNFEWALRELAERGHSIHVAVGKRAKDPGVDGLLDSLEEEFDGITSGPVPAIGRVGSARAAQLVRMFLDYLRYIEPAYAGADRLRERAGRRIPAFVKRLVADEGRRGMLRRLAVAVHEGLPTSGRVRRFLRDLAPDAVLATPLLELGSPQPEYLRAARRLGIPTGVPVASWDNLTNKGLFHECPDLITVWNRQQVEEIRELHGLPEDVVEITGAVAYDHWFDWKPSASREALCTRLGLDPERPFVLYVGSSPFIAPGEPAVALRWIEGLRERDERLKDLQVLVRPHPQNPMRGGARAKLRSMRGVVLYPPDGANPMDEVSRNDYFDSIFHSAAVLGVNTSALLEASIVDRPVHTLLEPDYRGSQMGTLHFRHLLPENGGMLNVAGDLDELSAAIAQSLEGDFDRSRNRSFVEAFLRPYGLDTPASPRLVASLEGLPARGAARHRGPVPVGRRLLALVVLPVTFAGLCLALAWKEVRVFVKRASRRIRPFLGDAAEVVAPRGLDGRRHMFRRPQGRGPGASSRRLRVETTRLQAGLVPLAESDAPIIAGPFLGEVGFELLYWIPFLRWSVQQSPGLADRLVVTSRGGTRSWYGDLAGRYVDVLDVVDPERLATGAERLKQRGKPTLLEEDIHAAVSDRLGLEGAEILHPTPFWQAYYRCIKADQRAYVRSLRPGSPDQPVAGLNSLYTRLDAPEPSPELAAALPDGEFAAVRFYFRPSFPDTEANRTLAREVIAALAAEMPVVVLNNGLQIDDHRDLEDGFPENVISLTPYMTPATNLEVQSVALSRARLFVGTYGGLAYLSPHYGVPSVGFADDQSHYFTWHLELAQQLFRQPEWGSLSVVSARDPEAVPAALAGLRSRGEGDPDT